MDCKLVLKNMSEIIKCKRATFSITIVFSEEYCDPNSGSTIRPTPKDFLSLTKHGPSRIIDKSK
jgi:hypothetical protein